MKRLWRWVRKPKNLTLLIAIGGGIAFVCDHAVPSFRSPENPKDVSAGAVQIAAIAAALIGTSVFAPRYLSHHDASIASYRTLICGELK